eukprot:m.266584 g.266584  ORF g.266584 m.266584 type:complete len:73 (+) comp40503_c0_seq4:662-880(+)
MFTLPVLHKTANVSAYLFVSLTAKVSYSMLLLEVLTKFSSSCTVLLTNSFQRKILTGCQNLIKCLHHVLVYL